ESCQIDANDASFTRSGDILRIAATQALDRDKAIQVLIRYSGGKEVNGDKGFHWVQPTATDPQRAGFWTHGEPEKIRQWMPTWDYPNDLATSETRVTVPADWYVVGNGELKSSLLNDDGRTRTFYWHMAQPHATYLISLAAGVFDIRTSEWN